MASPSPTATPGAPNGANGSPPPGAQPSAAPAGPSSSTQAAKIFQKKIAAQAAAGAQVQLVTVQGAPGQFVARDVPKSGDCLYDAMAIGLNTALEGTGAPPTDGETLRGQAVSYVDSLLADIAGRQDEIALIRMAAQANDRYPDVVSVAADQQLLEQYRTVLGQTAQWADPLNDATVLILSRLLNQRIEISNQTPQGIVPVQAVGPEGQVPVRLLQVEQMTHYQALLTPTQEQLAAAAAAAPAVAAPATLAPSAPEGEGVILKEHARGLGGAMQAYNKAVGKKRVAEQITSYDSFIQVLGQDLATVTDPKKKTALEKMQSCVQGMRESGGWNRADAIIEELSPRTKFSEFSGRVGKALLEVAVEPVKEETLHDVMLGVKKYTREAAQDTGMKLFMLGQFVDTATGRCVLDPFGDAQCQTRIGVFEEVAQVVQQHRAEIKTYDDFMRIVDENIKIHGIPSTAQYVVESLSLSLHGSMPRNIWGYLTPFAPTGALADDIVATLRQVVSQGTDLYAKQMGRDAAAFRGDVRSTHQLMEASAKCMVIKPESIHQNPMYIQPSFLAMKETLVNEFRNDREIVVRVSRVIGDAARGTTTLVGDEVLVYRPNKATGRFELVDQPSPDVKKQARAVFDTFTVLNVDAKGEVVLPDARLSDREQGLYSLDSKTFRQAMSESSIEHIIMTGFAGHPQFTDGCGARPRDPDGYLAGDVDPTVGRVDFDDGGKNRCQSDIFFAETRSPADTERALRADMEEAFKHLAQGSSSFTIGDPNYSLWSDDNLTTEFAKAAATAVRFNQVDRTPFSPLDPNETKERIGVVAPDTILLFPAHVFLGSADAMESYLAQTKIKQLIDSGEVTDGTLGMYQARGDMSKDQLQDLPLAARQTKTLNAAQMEALGKADRVATYEAARFEATQAKMARLQGFNDSIRARAERLLGKVDDPQSKAVLQKIVTFFTDNTERSPQTLGVDSANVNDYLNATTEYMRNMATSYLEAVDRSTSEAKLLETARTLRDQVSGFIIRDGGQKLTGQGILKKLDGAIAKMDPDAGRMPQLAGGAYHIAPSMTREQAARTDLKGVRDEALRFLDRQSVLPQLGREVTRLADDGTKALALAKTVPSTASVNSDDLSRLCATSRDAQLLGLNNVNFAARDLTIKGQVEQVTHALRNLEIAQTNPDFDADAEEWPATYRSLVTSARKELFVLGAMVQAVQTQQADEAA